MNSELSLCYYPTIIALVDDNEPFLSALKLQLAGQFDCNTFSCPIQALEYANKHHNEANIKEVELAHYDDYDMLVKQTLSKAEMACKKNRDDKEMSVIVVDYDMPGLNGIEFCERIENPNIKKVLLTGRASSSDAIKAFNAGIIHHYIDKSSSQMIDELKGAILKLQKVYFSEISSYLKLAAIKNSISMFDDPAFADYFDHIVARLDVNESYFLTHPPRYHLRHRDGKEAYLLVYTSDDIDKQINEMREEDAPEWAIEALDSRKCIPFFSSGDGYYDPEKFDASDIHNAELVEGTLTNYYCAVVDKKDVNPNELILPGFDSKNSTLH